MTDEELIARLRKRAAEERDIQRNNEAVAAALMGQRLLFDQGIRSKANSFAVRLGLEHENCAKNDAKLARDWDTAADRIEAQAAEIERLRDALAKAGRDLNMARYGQPDFAWSIHKQAMTDIQAKLENLIGGAETVLEAWDHHMRDVVVSASLNDAIEELRADVAELKGAKP